MYQRRRIVRRGRHPILKEVSHHQLWYTYGITGINVPPELLFVVHLELIPRTKYKNLIIHGLAK
jgi:hypothetical protein